jgi:flavin reductase (DIM6/NTAB) family NADH-FMN oxidoreductase RutF/rubredoxin
MSIDGRALWTISYGMYIVTAKAGEKANGQIANTVFQVTAEPPRFAIAINKENLTHGYIRESGHFAVSVLAESVPMELIGLFGFRSGRDVDKLASVAWRAGQHSPLVTEHAISVTEARVIGELDAGSHTVFLGEAESAEMLAADSPLTYAGYHARKGRAPKNAPTYQAETGPSVQLAPTAVAKYECGVCGFTYDPTLGDPGQGVAPGTPWEKLPDGWACPVCGAFKDEFKRA